MKILIIGAGAIGTMLGVSLADRNEVTFYVRESRAEKLRKNGFELNFAGKEKKIESPSLATSLKIGDEAPYDLAIVAVKSYSLDDILKSLDSSSFKWIMTCQNGIGNEEKLAGKYGIEKIISASITLPAAVDEKGKVTVTNAKGGIAFGKTSEDDSKPEEMADLFSESGFKTSVCNDYRAMKWSKVLLNMNSNALSAITTMTMEELFKSSEAVRLEKELFTEAIRLLRKNGIIPVDLPGYPVKAMNAMYEHLPVPFISAIMLLSGKAKSRGEKMPSLYIDIEKGNRNSEIDVLNGAVEQLGKDTGEPTPWNSFICSIFHEILSKSKTRAKYEDAPEKLLEDALKEVKKN